MSGNPDRHRTSARDDLALVHRILRGQQGDLNLLAERLGCIARALKLIDLKHGRKLGPDERAELSQDVLGLCWRKLGEYEGLSPLEGWIYGICVLEYRNALRRKQRLQHEVHVAARVSETVADATLDPDPFAYEEVHDGLNRIGREEAQVIRLKHFEGRTFEEIGLLLGITTSNAKARYYRGLEELRPLLEPKAGEG